MWISVCNGNAVLRSVKSAPSHGGGDTGILRNVSVREASEDEDEFSLQNENGESEIMNYRYLD